MSGEEPRPGWWQASDGNWYPPELATPPPYNPKPYDPPPESENKDRRRVFWIVGGVVGGLFMLCLFGGFLAAAFGVEPEPTEIDAAADRGSATTTTTTVKPTTTTTVKPTTTTTVKPTTTTTVKPTTTTTVKPTTTTTTAPPETYSQTQARKSAASYMSWSSMSRVELVHQLEFEGFSTEDALYAVSTLDVDWPEQTFLSGCSYQEWASMSQQELANQLEFEGHPPEYIGPAIARIWNRECG